MRRLWPVLLLLSCGGGGERTSTGHLEAWVEEAPRYATRYTVLRSGDRTRLLVFGPAGRTDTVGDHELVPHGTIVSTSIGPEQVVVPLQRMVLLSTTHAAYIALLDQRAKVVGLAYPDQVRDSALQVALRAGHCTDVGSSEQPDREVLLALRPDAVLGYPFGMTGLGAEMGGAPLIRVAEYLEPTPLARAEWLCFFGLLLGQEEMARQLFAGIEERYVAVRDRVDQGTAPTAVFFGSAWQGTWWVPGGGSYMNTLFRDAGGELLFSDGDAAANRAVDLESLLLEGDKARYWGMVVATEGELTAELLSAGDARLGILPPFAEDRLFAANSAKDDVFGRAYVEPDVVLKDLVHILSPDLAPDHVPVYYHRLQ